MRRSMTAMALMLAVSAIGESAEPMVARKGREPVPRKYTDARKAEAQAKRERKAAKRRKEMEQ